MRKRALSFLLFLALCCELLSASVLAADPELPTDTELAREWQQDQEITLADPAPWNLEELKQVVDVTDPRSVAAYWVWAVNRLVDNYDDGMSMMKYLFADIEPYGSGYTEGGMSGRAGWDTYFNDRLKDSDYSWLPRAYLEGAGARNGFKPDRPIRVALIYNSTETESLNGQRLAQQEQQGRLNIAYIVQSHAAGNRVSITLSRFAGSTRWYVTNGSASNTMFYDQRGSLNNDALTLAGETRLDDSTAEEHQRRYSGGVEQPVPSAAPVSGTEIVTSVALAVAEPEAWQAPSFTGRVIAGECVIDLTSSDEGINGIKWLDVTDGGEVVLTETDTFQPEHRYQVTISIRPKDGYVFNTEKFNAVINEDDVTKDDQSVCEDSAEVSLTFQPLSPSVEVKSITLTVAEPVPGAAPRFAVTLEGTGFGINTRQPGGGTYINGVMWRNTDDFVVLGENDTFQEGKTYSVSVALTVDRYYKFGAALRENPDAVTVNGKPATITGGEVDAVVTYVFTGPAAGSTPFADVETTDYYYDAVTWAYTAEPQVTNGVGDGQFGPDTTCTRAQVMTFIWRAAGCPQPQDPVNHFTDVPDDSWYIQAVLWAVEQGITNGVGENQFGPELTCTRSQVITMLYRAAGEPNKTGSDNWYDDAVNWAAGIGLLSGTEEAFAPEANCPRKDIVVYLFRELAE